MKAVAIIVNSPCYTDPQKGTPDFRQPPYSKWEDFFFKALNPKPGSTVSRSLSGVGPRFGCNCRWNFPGRILLKATGFRV